MADVTPTPTELALDALSYALNRFRTDVELWNVLDHTEALAKIVRAYAALSGKTEDEVRSVLEDLHFPHYHRVPDNQRLERRVEQLEQQLERAGIEPEEDADA